MHEATLSLSSSSSSVFFCKIMPLLKRATATTTATAVQ
jgi:hypothetical protein